MIALLLSFLASPASANDVSFRPPEPVFPLLPPARPRRPTDAGGPVARTSPPPLKPMGLGGALAYGGFAIVTEGALFWTCYYLLDRAGVPPVYNQLISLDVSFAPMMGLLAHDMKREGVTWETFGERMRFRKTRLGDWGWAVVAVGVGVGASFGLNALNDRIRYPIPDFMHPSFTPYGDPTADAYRSLIGSERIRGNWGPPLATTLGNQISVTAEELYWRGLMLPRMEAGLGPWAWVVQGLLWAPSHVFKYWEILPLFAATLPLSALGQKTKNTTVVYVTHTAINVLSGVGALYLVAASGLPESAVPTGNGETPARRLRDLRRIELFSIQGRF